MTKITIISCILAAVCIFQTEAGLFSDLTANSLLNNVQKHVPSNVRENIHELGETIQNRGKEVTEGIKNGLETSEKQLQTSTACTTMYNEGRETISQLISAFNSCFSNGINTADATVKKLISAMNNLHRNLSKDLQDTSKCFLNIFETAPCLSNSFQNFIKLYPLVEEVVNTALESGPKMFPKMITCYNDALLQLVNYEKFDKLIKNIKQCTKNVFLFSIIPIPNLPYY